MKANVEEKWIVTYKPYFFVRRFGKNDSEGYIKVDIGVELDEVTGMLPVAANTKIFNYHIADALPLVQVLENQQTSKVMVQKFKEKIFLRDGSFSIQLGVFFTEDSSSSTTSFSGRGNPAVDNLFRNQPQIPQGTSCTAANLKNALETYCMFKISFSSQLSW